MTHDHVIASATSNLPPEQVVRLDVPRAAMPVLVRRLGMAVADGYDESGVLRDLLGRVIEASVGHGLQSRIECRSCGYSWSEVPLVALCPVCGGRYLHVDAVGSYR